MKKLFLFIFFIQFEFCKAEVPPTIATKIPVERKLKNHALAKNRAKKNLHKSDFRKKGLKQKFDSIFDEARKSIKQRTLLGKGGKGGGKGAKPGGKNNNISITPPPRPQEILPPKPIIVAPLIVRQKRKANKIMVVRNGNLYGNSMYPAPYTPGFQMLNLPQRRRRELMVQQSFPGMPFQRSFPGIPFPQSYSQGMQPPYFPGYQPQQYMRPNYTPPRNLNGQQVSLSGISEDVPELTDSFKVSSDANNIVVSSSNKKKYEQFDRDYRANKFNEMLNNFADFNKENEVLQENIELLKGTVNEKMDLIGKYTEELQELKNQKIAAGLGRI